MVFFTDPQLADEQLMTSRSRETAYAYIQEQIKTHESIIRYYKGRRNALTFICRVPPEILVNIFQYVLRPANTSLGFYQISNIRNVTHVCSHWRQVALATPNLWANILLFPKQWTEEMVLRSKMAPLTIMWNVSSFWSSEAFPIMQDMLRNHLSRTKVLVLDVREYCGSEQRSDCLALLNWQAAPTIEHLEICFPAPTRRNPGDSYKLPDSIVIGTPNLKKLRMEGCGLAWELASFGNLKHLEIRDIPPALRPSVTQLLGVLSQTPLLETLLVAHIRRSKLSNGETASHGIDYDAIKLSCLQNIEIASSVSVTASLFDHLVLSNNMSSIAVKVTMQPRESSILTLRQMVRHFKDHLVEGDIVKLALGPITVEIWTSKTPQSTFGPPTIFIRTSENAHFWPSLGLDKLRSFVVNQLRLPASTWSLVGNLPVLEHLKVDYTNTSQLLDALCRGIVKEDENQSSSSDPSFTTLQTLTVSEWDWYACDGTKKALGARTAECFELRMQVGLRLKELQLNYCEGSREFRESLAKNIDVVHYSYCRP